MNIVDALRVLGGWVMDAVYPPRCCFCGALTGGGEFEGFCGKCFDALTFDERPSAAFSVFAASYGDDVTKAVYAMKYGGQEAFAALLADFVFLKREAALKPVCADLFVSVPLFKGKERRRGYNQAAVFARRLASLSGKPYLDALVRVRDTPPQAGLNVYERKINVKDAIVLADNICEIVSGKVIALCDDILTTGATMAECASALTAGGAEKVIPVVFAVAELKSHTR